MTLGITQYPEAAFFVNCYTHGIMLSFKTVDTIMMGSTGNTSCVQPLQRYQEEDKIGTTPNTHNRWGDNQISNNNEYVRVQNR
jgi:hypothetical protein